jgi:hypothetical protein
MLNSSGTGRINYAEVLHAIGGFIDQNNIKEVTLIEVTEGFLLRGVGYSTERSGFQTVMQQYLFTDEDIAQIVEEAYQRQRAQAGQTTGGLRTGPTTTGNLPTGPMGPTNLPPGPSNLPPGPSPLPPGPATMPQRPNTLPPGPGNLPPGPGQNNPQGQG